MSTYTVIKEFNFGKYRLQAWRMYYGYIGQYAYGVTLMDLDTLDDVFDLEFDTEEEAIDHFDMDKHALEVSV